MDNFIITTIALCGDTSIGVTQQWFQVEFSGGPSMLIYAILNNFQMADNPASFTTNFISPFKRRTFFWSHFVS